MNYQEIERMRMVAKVAVPFAIQYNAEFMQLASPHFVLCLIEEIDELNRKLNQVQRSHAMLEKLLCDKGETYEPLIEDNKKIVDLKPTLSTSLNQTNKGENK